MSIGQELQHAAPEPAASALPDRRVHWPAFTLEPASVLATLWLFLIALWTVAPSLFTGADPLVGDGADRFLPPSPEHWFGTDRAGRDLLSRTIYGTHYTVYGAIISTGVGLIVGTLLGVTAGVLRGRADSLLMRFVDVLLSMPGFLLALCVVAAFGPGTTHIAIGVGVGAIAQFARVARAEALRVVQLDFIDAARVSGAKPAAVLVRHVLPNASGPIVALIPTELGTTILQIAALGFLGFGEPSPTPEWGTLLSEGRDFLSHAWWLTSLPGFVVLFSVLASSRAGRLLQRRFQL